MVRIKNRYLVVQIVLEKKTEKSVAYNDNIVTKCVLKNLEKYYGTFGLASVEHGFRIKYCNDETRIAIIRCRHGAHRFVSSTLPLITVIGDHCAKFRILYVGATIMQCNKFIVNHQKNYLSRLVGCIQSTKERIDFINNVMDFEVN